MQFVVNKLINVHLSRSDIVLSDTEKKQSHYRPEQAQRVPGS